MTRSRGTSLPREEQITWSQAGSALNKIAASQ